MIWIVLGIIVLLVMFVIGIYNGLITARNGYKNAFAQIDVQLTRRHDLIPNLVETVKGYAAHEKGTLEAVIQARNAAVSADALRHTCFWQMNSTQPSIASVSVAVWRTVAR